MKTGKQNLKEGTDDWAPHVSGSPTPSALPCPARTPWPWPWPRAHGGGGVPPAAAQAGGGVGRPRGQDGRAVAGRSASARGPAQGQLVAALAAAQGTHGGAA